MSEVLEVTSRDTVGKLSNIRLRREGKLPAVLYGHGKESVNLTVPADGLEATLRHGAQVVQLKGAATGQALMQHIQWDTFQQHILHVDFLRVDAKDRVTVEVPLVLRGEAPGEKEGGIVEQLLHAVEIETSPANVPEHLQLSVNQLHLGGTLKVSDIEDVPEGVVVHVEPEAVLVQCVEPTILPEEVEEGAAEAEPEVIGQKDEEDESAEA
jgi:large subunit ribosomal protein L25